MVVTANRTALDTGRPGSEDRRLVGLLPYGTSTPDPPLLPYPEGHPLQPLREDLDEILDQRCASL
jgi:hypothetical protein